MEKISKKTVLFWKKYKISEKFFDKNKNIIEVPVTTYKVKAEYDKNKKLRYLDLTAKNKIFKKNFNTINWNSTYFVCLSHPGNLFNYKIKHGLLGFGVKNFIENLELFSRKNVIFENLKYFK